MEWWGEGAMSCNYEERLAKIETKMLDLITMLQQEFGGKITLGTSYWYPFSPWNKRKQLVPQEEMQALYNHLGLSCYKESEVPARLVVSKWPKTRKGGK